MKFGRIFWAIGLALGLTSPVLAQQAVVTSPASRVTTNASGTIAVTNTFQQIWAAQSSRVNCGIQNNDTNSMWVYFGSGTATKATSVVLAPGQFLNCATSGVVASSAVWITGTGTGVFYAGLDGAPIVSAPQVVAGGAAQLIGCTYNTTLPTYTNGQDTKCQSDSRGNLRVALGVSAGVGGDGQSNNTLVALTPNDSQTAAIRLLPQAPYIYNGTTWDRAPGNTLGAFAQGNVASGVADAGNPVKVGGVYLSSPPAYTNGQRADIRLTTRGAITIAPVDSNGNQMTAAYNADAVSASVTGQIGIAYQYNYNGTSADREFTCASTAVINVTAGATTQLIALSGSTVIRVCSYNVTASLAGTFKFVYGTGANCGTGTTDITGAMAIATADSNSMSSGNGSLFRGLAANALCLTAVTGNMTGFVTYAQY